MPAWVLDNAFPANIKIWIIGDHASLVYVTHDELN